MDMSRDRLDHFLPARTIDRVASMTCSSPSARKVLSALVKHGHRSAVLARVVVPERGTLKDGWHTAWSNTRPGKLTYVCAAGRRYAELPSEYYIDDLSSDDEEEEAEGAGWKMRCQLLMGHPA